MVSRPSKIKFPSLGDMSNWAIEAFADVRFKTLPDQVSSCGGQVVLMHNKESGDVCTLSWKGKKLKRIVTSSTAGETLALNEVISEVVFIKALLNELCGTAALQLPVHLYTDSKNVVKAVHSTSLVDDPRLRTEIACLKESLENGEITSLVHIPGKTMLANCMTKKGASAKDLLNVIQNGQWVDVLEPNEQ